MTQRDNILQELRELQSSLVNAAPKNIYRVPDGYFEGLTDQLLRRIKALEAQNASEELDLLSPLVNSISKKMPYSVPAGFFDDLSEKVIESLEDDHQTPAEELETLSPLLSGLKKEMPYHVPQGYFEGLSNTLNTETIKPVAVVKVVSITRQKWFRYAAAAVVIGFIAMTGFLLINKNEPAIDGDPEAIVNKMMKKVSTDEIDHFVQMINEETPVVASTDIKELNEVKELIKDIPDKDIQEFLDETQLSEPDNNNDDLLLN